MVKHVKIIAEIGSNFTTIEEAKKLIKECHKIGVDIVKFQSFNPDTLVNVGHSGYDTIKKHSLSYQDHIDLSNYCNYIGIEFMCTPFDLERLEWLESLEYSPKRYKIASGDLTYDILLEDVAKTKKQIILSTGLSYEFEIEHAIEVINKINNSNISFLHCTSLYPTNPEHVMLLNMVEKHNKFNDYQFGLSDHSLGYVAVLGAVALGATIIEKHIKLNDSNPNYPDYGHALTIKEFGNMIIDIRKMEKMLGYNTISPNKDESIERLYCRRYAFTNQYIKKGDILTLDKIKFVRPSNSLIGIASDDYKFMINRQAVKNIDINYPILPYDYI